MPPPAEMDALYQLALAGNMRAIRHHAEHLAGLDGQYRPFADMLQQLAQAYQSQAILSLVTQYMSQEKVM
ncbi:MAG: hypothetical protein P4L83_06510 [Nevskia sp.]|nr:hypothetical protein [Nevskia sp.]